MKKKIFAFTFSLVSLMAWATDKAPKAPKSKVAVANKTLTELRLRNMYQQMELSKSGLDFNVFERAFLGYANLEAMQLLSDKQLLTVIDFGKSSREKRLWVLDLKDRKVIFHSLVAHGQKTGDDMAKNFSNLAESHMSSLGFYVTSDTYQGKHGFSLRLQGLESKYNSNALSRAVVMHGADYVSENFIKKHGRLGRSHGCPALPMGLHKEIIDSIKGKTCLYIHAPESGYQSDFQDISKAFEQIVKLKFE